MTSHRIVEIRDQFAKAELALKKYERIGLTSIACAVPEHRLLGVAAALAAFILVSTGAYVVSKRFLISAVTKQLLE